ncbi:MAG: NAD(P)-dependent oxidoreductase [Burkholderiales bacterium]|jgi:putative NADH-flavin reductase|nr:NAD(P)-dependent oxidoreductase [Burkholderiales bacterium]
MNIALIGASGFVGSKVLAEALQRGHLVTAIVRAPGKVTPQKSVRVVVADASDAASLANAAKGHDAIVSAYNAPRGKDEFTQIYLAGVQALIGGAKQSGVTRILWVGGAGSLYVAPGVQLVDTPQFPAEYKTEALAGRDAYRVFLEEKALAWTFVSPAPLLAPGERTGRFRLGRDEVLMNGDMPGNISVEDLAVAIVDELEKPAHIRQRFTVAY